MTSVIIPAYKNLELFRQAAHSVMAQSLSDLELIVVDDTPNDTIANYCKTLNDKRIRYYHNHPLKGATNNWNYGFSIAKGDNIILLHHDESFANSNYLERVELLLREYDVIISNKKVLIANKEKKERFPKWIKQLVIYSKYPIFSLNVIGPCACVAFRKEFLQEFDIRMHWKVDIDWYFRVLKSARRIKYLESKEILSHHGHEDQITNNIDINANNKSDIALIKEKYKNCLINISLMLGKVLLKI